MVLSPGVCVTAIVPVGKVGVPVKVGESIVAFKAKELVTSDAFALALNAVVVAALMGLFASEVLSTLAKPTIVLVIPPTVPVNVGDSIGAFKANVGTVGESAVPPKSPANLSFPLIVVLASMVPAAVASWTKAVVANLVELSVEVCVLAVVAVGNEGVPVNAGEFKGAAPVTSASGMLALADMADVPVPLIYPVNVLAPVPPFKTATIPLTFAAFPAIFPVTLLPATPTILTSVTEASAKSTVAILPSRILAEFMAPVAMAGEAADPAKSPAS